MPWRTSLKLGSSRRSARCQDPPAWSCRSRAASRLRVGTAGARGQDGSTAAYVCNAHTATRAGSTSQVLGEKPARTRACRLSRLREPRFGVMLRALAVLLRQRGHSSPTEHSTCAARGSAAGTQNSGIPPELKPVGPPPRLCLQHPDDAQPPACTTRAPSPAAGHHLACRAGTCGEVPCSTCWRTFRCGEVSIHAARRLRALRAAVAPGAA